MFPNYMPFLNRMALKVLNRPLDVPNFHLGIFPYEVMENIEDGRLSRTIPMIQTSPVTGGVPVGQTYTGLPGYGSIVPDSLPTQKTPYYGDYLGGG